MAQPMRPPSSPRATYRVQLHGGFGFDDVAAIVPYLAKLGITHLYCSPYLQARAGSTHGYDIVDHARFNEELGGEEGHARLLDALRKHGMGHILDIVPNHMAINDPANAWWWDILKNGPHSPYATFFDIDWGPSGDESHRRVLVPLLSDRYERVLEAGEVTFGFIDGEPVARYHNYALPLAPATEPDDVESVNRDDEGVHAVLERQHYRLAYWRDASRAINYRRFFAINDLAALRAENPEVFRRTHSLILGLVDRGDLQGLRVDHVDGLKGPAAYLAELRAAAPDAYIVVEKVLEIDERLPEWPVQGTTGYDFLNRVNTLFVDPAGEAALTSVYESFTGDAASLDNQRRAKKLAFVDSELASDLERLTDLMTGVCEREPRKRDYKRDELRSVLAETMAAWPVYRTYADRAAPSVSETDREVIEGAVETARARADLPGGLFDLLRDALLLRIDPGADDDLALRFQQTTGAVMAKAIEDTLFYTYNRLVSLNEVGGDPGRFGVSLEEFHRLNAAAQRDWPESMLATSTHDTKRSEDVRLRISLLSQMPERWGEAVGRWSEKNDRYRRNNQPSRDDEYLLYQTLVGAWPLGSDRAIEYMAKAAKEAKVHTSWIDPDHDYDAALRSFVGTVLSDETFVSEMQEFVAPLVRPGRIASLAQTLMKLTAPGVPDIYQGSEVWDLSLVDPDNRRPVDYDVRRRIQDSIGDSPPSLSDDGAAKMFVVQRALAVRDEQPEAFGPDSTYEPLAASGDHDERVVAYVRAGRVIAVAPRLAYELPDITDTTLDLPPGTWTDRFSGRTYNGVVSLGELWGDFPVSLLTIV